VTLFKDRKNIGDKIQVYSFNITYVISLRKNVSHIIFIVIPCMLSSYSIITPTTAHI